MKGFSYLKKAIYKEGLDTKLTAAIIGTTEYQLMKWVIGETSPSLRYALRLREILGNGLDLKRLLSTQDIIRNKEWDGLSSKTISK